jgi:hypothetical protein
MSAVQALPPVMASVPAEMGFINPLEMFINSLNTNPYFIGFMMLLLNLGGRFIGMEMSKEQEKTFQHPWIRKFFIFTVFFVATRNILVALALTIVTLLLLAFLLNETSDFYIFGTKTVEVQSIPTQDSNSTSTQNGLTFEEKEILKRLTEKQMKFASTAAVSNPTTSEQQEKILSAEENYFENLTHLQH